MSIQDLSQKLIDDMRTILEGGTVELIVEDNTNDKSDDGEGLDKVQPKAVKKKFKDRKDKDIDNDGDTDDSDEYLHKKRKAISKNIKQDEGKLPPALQKAIDAKKGKGDDDDDEEEVKEGQFWGDKKMSKAHIAKLKKSGAVMLQKKEKSGSVGRITLPKGHKDIAKYVKQGYKQIEIESVEEGKGGKYLKYSDLLLKKQRMSKTADKTAINKEIKKERQHLGITEENLEDLLIHYLPEQEK
jgi:hypothetical protein